jgi:transposase, IS30 family
MVQTYTRLTQSERIRIEVYKEEGYTNNDIAIKLGRSPSSILREIARFPRVYKAHRAQKKADKLSGSRNTGRKLDKNPKLFKFVHEHLKKRWSPQQISVELKRLYPQEKTMQVSHEAIYTYIYLLPRGELRKELTNYLRQQKKSRYRRKGKYEKRGTIPEMISIEERPKEVENRSIAGHWEGDLILGKRHQSALGTIVERKTRTVIMVPLKSRQMTDVRKAFERELKTLPVQMKKSLTYDQGKEMSEHRLFTKNSKMKVYFCHPASPWERGTCENTNMLIRSFFPKGTDFSKVSRKEIKKVQALLNERPRKTLNWKKPIEVFEQEALNKSK